jgi:hypothetical protein
MFFPSNSNSCFSNQFQFQFVYFKSIPIRVFRNQFQFMFSNQFQFQFVFCETIPIPIRIFLISIPIRVFRINSNSNSYFRCKFQFQFVCFTSIPNPIPIEKILSSNSYLLTVPSKKKQFSAILKLMQITS